MTLSHDGFKMLNINTIRQDSVTLLVIAVIVSSLAVQVFSPQQSEIETELFSWAILPFLFRWSFLKSHRNESYSTQPCSTTSTSLWLVAAGLTLSCLFRAEAGIIKAWPLLTPLLLASQSYFYSKGLTEEPAQSLWHSRVIGTALATVLPSFLALWILADANLVPWPISLVAVLAMFLVYIAFLPRPPQSLQGLPLIGNIESDITRLSQRVAVCLIGCIAAQTYAFGFTYGPIISSVVTVICKTTSWYFMIRLSYHTSWILATLIGTFTLVCVHTHSLQISAARTGLGLAAAFVTLAQIVHTVDLFTAKAKAKSLLWILVIIPFVSFLLYDFQFTSALGQSGHHFDSETQHPIELLAANAKNDFAKLRTQQSTTYANAEKEYKRRYNMEPPAGFAAWFEFAVKNRSPLIDDFDTMYNGISPFWSLSGAEVLRNVNAFENNRASDVWRCALSAGSPQTFCTHPTRSYDKHVSLLFSRLLSELHLDFPDITVLVNALDEPRVLIPQSSEQLNDLPEPAISLTSLAHQPIWGRVTASCGTHEDDVASRDDTNTDFSRLPFVANARTNTDLCKHADYGHLHGLFIGPTSFSLVEGFVPILSPGSISTMGDILLPSAAYIEDEYVYDAKRDIEWAAKKNVLHWTGSTSGGYAASDQWRLYHRQRFVTLAQNLSKQPHAYLRGVGGVIQRITSSMLNSNLYDVAVTRVYQCLAKYCRKELSFFKTHSWTDRDLALQSRLLFDTDGNGISGRYYKFLASKSTPLKQTVFREWHDDRLVPWLHYIPVSQSLEELPELVSYLTGDPKGQRLAESIGQNGQDWYQKAFREVDLSIYLYRLVLELARLQDPTRPARPAK